MEWVIGFIILFAVGGLVELFDRPGFRSKISAVFGWLAVGAFSVLAFCVIALSYVGVWIVYICIPTLLISAFLCWIFKPKNIE